ncbi:MAG: isoprenoid biosynthesis glyoxalase ElbB [Candidatus Omnitrophica bacterium]|nr:isoprenoid biosynthesis glyoxalase ElbB [Candidatus Omnitrophota bacterium]
MPRIGVVLSGCGVMDGSEIHESVLTLLALSKAKAEAVCMAPNSDQLHVINHLTGVETQEKRNILVESARIARGKIRDIKEVQAGDVDALIFPGGYGAAKNLCTFAVDGTDCKVHPEVARLVREVHQAGKPIGAICIAPALVAKIFEGSGVGLTIGKDRSTADQLERLGSRHHECGVNEIWVDADHKIVTTPAYMLAQNVAEAWQGIEKLVNEILRLVQNPVRAGRPLS